MTWLRSGFTYRSEHSRKLRDQEDDVDSCQNACGRGVGRQGDEESLFKSSWMLALDEP